MRSLYPDDYVEAKRQKALGDTIYVRIREDIIDSLLMYAYRGIPTGSFLQAVLSNNLREAIGRADHENIKVLKEIVMFVYMELPAPCWGSEERVKEWLK